MHQHGLTLIKDEQKKGLHLEMKRFFYPNLVDDQKKKSSAKIGAIFCPRRQKKRSSLKIVTVFMSIFSGRPNRENKKVVT